MKAFLVKQLYLQKITKDIINPVNPVMKVAPILTKLEVIFVYLLGSQFGKYHLMWRADRPIWNLPVVCLNSIKTYCFSDWKMIPESIRRRRLIVDRLIASLVQFWALSSIGPLCGWSATKKLRLIYTCVLHMVPFD